MDYQQQARKFRLPSASHDYAVLNLAAEAGEVASLRAKAIRDTVDFSTYRTNVIKELGDVMWMIAAIADDVGTTFEEITQVNIDKLTSRQARNVIQGSGDDR